MKLNSKYLKELILEVIDEATRRDFLRGAVGLGATAALGGKVTDASADGGSFPGGQRIRTVSDEDVSIEQSLRAPISKQQGKIALDKLRVTPDMEYYTVAPVQDSVTNVPYAYVDMNAIYDEADQIPELDQAISEAEAFYQDFTILQHYNYVFGQLAFWGTFKDESDPRNMQMTKTVKSKDPWERDVDVKILPAAWTVSLDVLLNRILLLNSKIQQYPMEKRNLLAEEGLTLTEYEEMMQSYNQLINNMNNAAFIQNPNYKPEER
tara:strand:+ start:355 stop:1149 length:795 start_codon:yes stop_codon:yes gene_type:complete